MPWDRPRDIEALHREYGTRIYRFCYRLCGQTEDAEDLAQDVLLAAGRGLESFQGRSSVLTWLYRITLNRWQRFQKERGPAALPLMDHLLLSSEPDPAEVSVTRVMLEHAMRALPEDQREALLLVKVEGLSCRQAADVLGAPTGTVKSRVYYALLRMQAAMSEEDPASRPSPASGKEAAKARGRKEHGDDM